MEDITGVKVWNHKAGLGVDLKVAEGLVEPVAAVFRVGELGGGWCVSDDAEEAGWTPAMVGRVVGVLGGRSHEEERGLRDEKGGRGGKRESLWVEGWDGECRDDGHFVKILGTVS